MTATVKSGVSNPLLMTCPTHGADCPIHKLSKLKRDFFGARQDHEIIMSKEGFRLGMAEFVRDVSFSVAKINKDKMNPLQTWKRMKPNSKTDGKNAEIYEHTYLYDDIEKLTRIKSESQEEVDRTGKALIDYFKETAVQEHLVDIHGSQFVKKEIAEQVYEIPSTISANRILLLDHIVAEVTEGLTSIEAGRDFCEDLLDEEQLKKYKAVSEVWGTIGKIKNAKDHGEKIYNKELEGLSQELEAVGRFFYNVSPVLSAHISKLTADGSVTSILKLSYDKKFIKLTGFLEKKFGFNISDCLLDIGEKFCLKYDGAVALLKKGKSFDKAFSGLTKEAKAIHPVEYAKYDVDDMAGAWFGLVMDVVGLTIASIEFSKKIDNDEDNLKDWLDLLQNVSSTVKSASEISRAYVRVSASSGDEIVGSMMKVSPNGMTKWVKGATIVAGLMTACISVLDAKGAIDEKDYGLALLHLYNAGIAVAGVITAVVGLTSATVVFAIVGAIIGFIISKVKDPEILNYLEKTVWSKKSPSKIALKDTIDGFYAALYKLSVSFHLNEKLKEHSYFLIETGAFNNETRLCIELKANNVSLKKGEVDIQKETLAIKRAKGIDASGIPRMQKSHFWHDHRYKKSVKVFSIAETWTQVSKFMIEGSSFTVKAGIDPSGQAHGVVKNMALMDTIEDLELNLYQPPVLFGFHYASDKSRPFLNPPSGNKMELYSNNSLKVRTFVRNAESCQIRIRIDDELRDYYSPYKTIHGNSLQEIIIPITVDKYWGNATSARVEVQLFKSKKQIATENYMNWTLFKHGKM